MLKGVGESRAQSVWRATSTTCFMSYQCLDLVAHSASSAILMLPLWFSDPLQLKSSHCLTTLCARCSHFLVWTVSSSSSLVCCLRAKYSSVLLVFNFFLKQVSRCGKYCCVKSHKTILLNYFIFSVVCFFVS